jgi:hypothetical protein
MRSTLTGSQEDLIRTGEQTESNLRLQQFLAQQKAKSTAEAVERMENAPGSSGRWANRFKQVSNSQASKASQLGSQRMGLMTERNALTSNIKSHFEPDRFDPKVESAQAYLERHAIDSSQIPKSAGKQVRRKKVRGRKAT